MVLAEDLRQAVLQAALQGKLTERLETDSDAENVVKEIKEKKKQLIKTGDIKKPKLINFIFDNDILFEIPDYWEWVMLDDITTVLGDGLHGTPQYDDNGDYYFINGNNLMNKRIIIKNDTRKITAKEYDRYKKDLNDNTILISINGTLGNIAFYNNENIILGKSACYFNLFENINKEFLYYFFSSFFFQRYIRENATGTTIKNVSLEVMRSTHIPFPPIEEQQRIVDKINEIMPKINEYEKIEKELQVLKKEFPTEMKNSLLQAAMQGKLTEQLKSDSSVVELLKSIEQEKEELLIQNKIKKEKVLSNIEEEEIPFEIPNNWRWVRLGNISTYGQSKEKIISKDIHANTWVLDLEDIEKDTGRIISKSMANKKKIAGDKVIFKKNDILYSKLRPYLLKILVAPENGICTPELVPFQLFGGIDVYYIMFVLKSPYINYTVNSATYGMKMPRVGTKTMLNLLIPIPPIEEQQRIVERLNALLPLCEQLKEK